MAGALTYVEALEALERALKFGINPSLDGIRALVAETGGPDRAFHSVQVTGTNGKTSVTRLLSAILSAHGLRTGTYTSPHLVSYTERMMVDGAPVTEAAFGRALGAALDASGAVSGGADEFTEFELLTSAALVAFREARVLWAVLEVGMGGRWDATSVVSPRVSVVTGVGLDHTERLGSTREAIAADKAYVIKPGSIAVIGPGCAGVESLLLDRAAAMGVPVVRVGLPEPDVTWEVTAAPTRPGGMLRLDVSAAFASYAGLAVAAPSYQAPNIAVAIAAAEAAMGGPLDPLALGAALGHMTFPGRFEVVHESPFVVIDGAHNPEAARVLAGAVREAFGQEAPVFVLGAMKDKDVAGIIRELLPVSAGFFCTGSRSERAMPPAGIADAVRSQGGVVLAEDPTVQGAISSALRHGSAGIVAAGSIYVAGEARAALLG